jgi:hypothetical protein
MYFWLNVKDERRPLLKIAHYLNKQFEICFLRSFSPLNVHILIPLILLGQTLQRRSIYLRKKLSTLLWRFGCCWQAENMRAWICPTFLIATRAFKIIILWHVINHFVLTCCLVSPTYFSLVIQNEMPPEIGYLRVLPVIGAQFYSSNLNLLTRSC